MNVLLRSTPIAIAAASVILTACGGGDNDPAPSPVAAAPAAPTCVLSVSPSAIKNGDQTMLSWNTANTTAFAVDQGVGAQKLVTAGWQSVSPATTTTYTGTATGPGGTATCASSVTVAAPAPVATLAPGDLTFANVQTDRYDTTVTRGERNILAAGIQIQHKSSVKKARVTQFVFQNMSANYDPAAIKRFRMVDSFGNDLPAAYTVTADKNGKVVIDFAVDWDVAQVSSGRIFWLDISMSTGAVKGTKFAFVLKHAQTHEAYIEVVSEVKGGEMAVVETAAGTSLPTVTTTSPAIYAAPPLSVYQEQDVATIAIACPKDEADPCVLVEIKDVAAMLYGTSVIIDHVYYGPNQTSWDGTNYSSTFKFFGLSINPGETKTLTFRGIPFATMSTFKIVDMTMAVGSTNNQVTVSPYVPAGDCTLVVGDCPQN